MAKVPLTHYSLEQPQAHSQLLTPKTHLEISWAESDNAGIAAIISRKMATGGRHIQPLSNDFSVHFLLMSRLSAICLSNPINRTDRS